MKGIAIYSNPMWGDNDNTVYCQPLMCAKYRLQMSSARETVCALEGEAPVNRELTKATCSPDDEYDFEIGALIALMKMYGKEKTEKAYRETFFKGGDPGDCPYYQVCKEPTIKRLEEEIETLRDNNKTLMSSRDRLLNESMDRLRDKIDLKGKYVALKAENEKLKLDCEKLKKGYSAGLGRVVNINGVNYRECDERGRVVWMTSQPESLSFSDNFIDTDTINTLKMWHKDSEIKPLSSKCPSWLDGKKWGFVSIDEWAFKPPTKREQMWDDILKEGRTPVYVKREDIHDFLEECQVVGIKWSSGKMPLETMPFHMSEGYDGVYFFIMTTLDISKTKRGSKKFRHVMSWWCTADPAEVEAAIHYIRPMRWDLFEKGRLYIRVKAEHFEEFQKACKAHLECGKWPLSPFHYCSNGDVIVRYTDEHFRLTTQGSRFKTLDRPVVNWEDVR